MHAPGSGCPWYLTHGVLFIGHKAIMAWAFPINGFVGVACWLQVILMYDLARYLYNKI
jgi:hypothetical protein